MRFEIGIGIDKRQQGADGCVLPPDRFSTKKFWEKVRSSDFGGRGNASLHPLHSCRMYAN